MADKRNGSAGSMAAIENIGFEEDYNFSQLQKMKFPRLHWVVEGIIVEGLTILAARPKLGKSWMMLDVLIAAATGGKALSSIKCQRMVALYYALEDNQRRLLRRGQKLLKGEWPKDLYVRHKLRRLDRGGIDDIREWVEERKADLVVIDTFNHIRPPRKLNEEAYSSDYQWLGQLQALATELKISIVVVHHVRKAEATDPLDLINGSTGLQAAADTLLVLTRDSDGVVLHGSGKDLEDQIELAIEFDRDACKWSVLGPAEHARLSPERKSVLEVLRNAENPLGPTEIAKAVDKRTGSVTKMLYDMTKAGQLRKTSRGLYEPT